MLDDMLHISSVMFVVFSDRFHLAHWQKSQGFLLQINWQTLVGSEPVTEANKGKDSYNIVATFNNDNASLAGSAVVSNPLLGHVCLYRSVDGVCGVANVTVRSRVAEMHKRLHQIADRFSEESDAERSKWMHEASLLRVVEELADRAYEGISATPRAAPSTSMV